MKILIMEDNYEDVGYDIPKEKPFEDAWQETFYTLDSRWNIQKTRKVVSRNVEHEVKHPDGSLTRVTKETVTEVPTDVYKQWLEMGIRHVERPTSSGEDINFERHLPELGWFIEVNTLEELMLRMHKILRLESNMFRYIDIPFIAVI